MSLKQPRKMDFPYLYLNTIYIDKPGVEILETSTLTSIFRTVSRTYKLTGRIDNDIGLLIKLGLLRLLRLVLMPALYCWFSVSRHSKQIKIKLKTILQKKSRIWEMKGGKYTKTLAKIWIEGIIRIRDIRGNVLPKFIELCMETPCWNSSG